MYCPKCNRVMREIRENYQYQECGLDNVWLQDWDVFLCARCDSHLAILPDAELAILVITRELVRQPRRLDGKSILFLRKGMRLKGQELADALGVHRVEISRWENEHVAIDPFHDLRLRLAAIDHILEPC